MSSELLSTEVISKLLEISPRRIQQLAKLGYIPKSSRGKYPLVGSVQGYIRYLRAQEKEPEEQLPVDKMTPNERLKYYRAEQARDELMVSRRQLIPAEEVERGTAELVKAMVSLLETLPDVLERDAGIQPHATARVIASIDAFRDEAYSKLSEASKVVAA